VLRGVGARWVGVVRVVAIAAIVLAVLGVDPGWAQTSRGKARSIGNEKRVALVVGNSAYRYVGRLDNPKNDAKLVSQTLQSLGFTLIGGGPQLDLAKEDFDRAVQDFAQILSQGADVALFYYAGHGIQARGTNWLLPTSANPNREIDVEFQAIDAQLVLRVMESAGTRLNMMILDACRNNPLAGRGLRSASGGLAQMQAPEGSLIVYATQPGNTAMDGSDGDSPFTKALAQTMKKPGLDVFRLFNEVGLQVKRATGGAQQPWVSSSPIDGDFYFAGAAPGGGGQIASPPAGGGDAELMFWQTIAGSTNPADFRAYLDQYPNGRFAALARRRAEPAPAPATPQVAVVVPKPAPAVPDTLVNRGVAAHARHDYAEAVADFQRAADSGDADGMAALGAMTLMGVGTARQYDQGLNWMKTAAARGIADPARLNNLFFAHDPHSAYIPEAEYADLQTSARGEFAGIGAEVASEEHGLKIVSPIDDTPAARAGLRPGDVVVRIEGAPTEGLSLMQAVNRLRGPVGSTVRLAIARGGQIQPEVALTRSTIRVVSVKSSLQEGRIGYIRLTQFTANTSAELRAALDGLNRQAGGLAGLILDLRNNPGGLLSEVTAAAGEFLDGQTVVQTVAMYDKLADQNQTYTAPRSGDRLRGVRMIVLVNAGTASGAEILAGALQDNRRATILGIRSFGKGRVQTILPLDGHGALRLTTAEFILPSGRHIQETGIVPDKIVASAYDQAATPAREAEVKAALAAGRPVPQPVSATSTGAVTFGGNDDEQFRAAIAELR
jgi:C-terminal peptidase prc